PLGPRGPARPPDDEHRPGWHARRPVRPSAEPHPMQSKAKTVDEYLKSLPEDRRQALASVRRTILANLDSGFEEGMQYGMIGYFVPHRVFPAGYHCDPKQPLPYAGLAAQKNHLALYAGCLYGGD